MNLYSTSSPAPRMIDPALPPGFQSHESASDRSRDSKTPDKADLVKIRTEIEHSAGRKYWRSLEQLADCARFRQSVEREFPCGTTESPDDLSRRSFLKLSAACLALAGLTACTKQPVREIFPYIIQPPDLVLGEPLYYATSCVLGGFATGVLAKNREGHPIKIDGNPDHPASLGSSSAWLQSAILDLYDPDRSQTVLHNGDLSSWSSLLSEINTIVSEEQTRDGAGLRFLTQTVTSPTLAAQLADLLQRFPKAQWHQFEPISRDSVRAGSRIAFGEIFETQYQVDAASLIVSLESDFLYMHPQRLRYSQQFAERRRVSGGQKEVNRLYAIESSPSVTGAMADHRLPVASSKIGAVAKRLCQKVGLKLSGVSDHIPGIPADWIDALAGDLDEHRGRSLVVVGDSQPPAVHALAHALNEHLGNVGNTLFYTKSAEAAPVDQLQSITELSRDIQSGRVETLFILEGNPAYAAPADLLFPQLLAKVKRSIHLGLELDETAALSTWHVPAAHFLEAWGDSRSFDGTVSLMQPLIQPLYNGKTAYELLGALSRQQPHLGDFEIVRNFWQTQNLWPDFEAGWRKALHDGFIANSAFRPLTAHIRDLPGLASQMMDSQSTRAEDGFSGGISSQSPDPSAVQTAAPGSNHPRLEATSTPSETTLELCFRPDASVWDGRFANNGWLQECPRPITKLTWDNAALISPALAQRFNLAQNDVVELKTAQGQRAIPIWILPGQAENTVTVHLGYGRTRVGRVGTGVGVNVYPLRSSRALWNTQGVRLIKTSRRHTLVSTQAHHAVESSDRQVLRECDLRQLLDNPNLIKDEIEQPQSEETLYDNGEYPYRGYKWGMSIDLSTCIGCNACLLACEAENNIPFVGKDQVQRGREMFWIRVDTYYKDSLDNPGFAHMPVPCMHCEHAPCELVCPVEATVHDHEGLNLQVYNRCVGTRFCSNNCPYKVRRFNFFQYSNYHQPSYRSMYNPEVTLRWRGVMEKCTYCIQRISSARITAEKENRRIGEREIQTACQQACPAKAIVFGDLNDPGSQVARLKNHPLDYSMLGQLNTRPRTTYLARVQNPRPS